MSDLCAHFGGKKTTKTGGGGGGGYGTAKDSKQPELGEGGSREELLFLSLPVMENGNIVCTGVSFLYEPDLSALPCPALRYPYDPLA